MLLPNLNFTEDKLKLLSLFNSFCTPQ